MIWRIWVLASAMIFGEQPVIIAIGGGPASGKTTLRNQLVRDDYVIHDIDVVLLRLPGYQQDLASLGPKGAFENWWRVARELADSEAQQAIAERRSILYDRTCGSEGSYLDLRRAKEEGYFIRMIGLRVDRTVAYERARVREQVTGRAVTEAIIDEYSRRFSAFWPRYLEFVDEAFLYDTTQNPPLLIYSSEKGVLDEGRYQAFLEEGIPFR